MKKFSSSKFMMTALCLVVVLGLSSCRKKRTYADEEIIESETTFVEYREPKQVREQRYGRRVYGTQVNSAPVRTVTQSERSVVSSAPSVRPSNTVVSTKQVTQKTSVKEVNPAYDTDYDYEVIDQDLGHKTQVIKKDVKVENKDGLVGPDELPGVVMD
ncbi:hypothetical protein KG892_00960 [Vermiphilus pyriformis]|uniref:Uncharacterized protein n=1 Tax=candidate division TM6 bacterium JCVI TM6SC1 TaxID=1306947 RepID=A0A0D2K3Z3_9BACT|nr:hypothetical protein J120_03580 [candidate division TM6 bacterium JCVI TM6SC1]UNE35581.1 MAG: hypothetical protein KG892_00960 [Vermiphilus pyriformis]